MVCEYTRQPHQKRHVKTDNYYAQAAITEGMILKLGTHEGTVIQSTANAVCWTVALNAVTALNLANYEARGDLNQIQVIAALPGTVAPVLAGGQIAAGAWVKSDTNGRVVAAALDGTENLIGICLHATSADGDPTHIFIHPIPAINQGT